MTPKIALYSGNFNPPGKDQVRVVTEMIKHFDRVIIVPAGPRPEKPHTEIIAPIYRAAMADMAFGHLENVDVELFDLERASFSPTHELQRRFEDRGEIWHVIGTDMIAGGSQGKSKLHGTWQKAKQLWQDLNFSVVTREDIQHDSNDLPPKHLLFNLRVVGSGAELRENLFRRQPVDGLIPPRVEKYIRRYHLYRGAMPARTTLGRLEDPRILICAAKENEKAIRCAERYQKYSCSENPNLILVIGGDGTMLQAIRKNWRLRIPFFGINAGHLGFLLNDSDEVKRSLFPSEKVILRQMPMIYVQVCPPGENPPDFWSEGLAFNDVWVERSTGQTAWLKVKVNEHVRFGKLICDGLLMSTAAGSTAYARSMGATPLLADTMAWLLVGSNVVQPSNWKSALLPFESGVEIEVMDHHKRPVVAYLGGDSMGQVGTMRARISRIAAVELAYLPQHDMTEKITQIQFPKK